MQLGHKTTTNYEDSQEWLGASFGTDAARSVTLYLAGFVEATHYANGFIPSGMPLSRKTSGTGSGMYVPYAGRTNTVQAITVATAGNTTVNFDGETTGALNIAANSGGATALRTALQGLPNIDSVTIAVGADADVGKLIVTFGGIWAGRAAPAFTVSGTDAAVATVTAGGSADSEGATTLAGFLLSPIEIRDGVTVNPQGALLEFGRVVEAKLPIAIDAPGKGDVDGRIVFQ